MAGKKHVLILNPTPNEFLGCQETLSAIKFKNISTETVMTGMGKINAAFALANLAQKPDFIVGAGTSGSLNRGLKSGDVIISDTAIIGDWVLKDAEGLKHAPYENLDYRAAGPQHLDRLQLKTGWPDLEAIKPSLTAKNLIPGAMLTADTFVADVDHKISSGRQFGCLACDMESGVFSYLAATKLMVPCLNLRVIADTIDHSLDDYVAMEKDMVKILAEALAMVLKEFDQLYS